MCVGIARRESSRAFVAGEFRQQREGRGAGREGVAAARVVAGREGQQSRAVKDRRGGGGGARDGTGPGGMGRRGGKWRVARGGTSGKRREVEESGSGGCKPLTPAERRATPR